MVYLILALGVVSCLLSIASPRTVWYLRYGWRFKNAEPSVLSLTLTRVSGVVGIVVIAIIALFVAPFAR